MTPGWSSGQLRWAHDTRMAQSRLRPAVRLTRSRHVPRHPIERLIEGGCLHERNRSGGCAPADLTRPDAVVMPQRSNSGANMRSYCMVDSDIRERRRLPLGVRSEPTPPPRPRLDVAPPAPGRLPADGPARFGQQPAVPPVFDQVSLDTESFAELGKSNRLMLRVRVRHGAPGAYSQSERRCAWEPAPAGC